MKGERQADLADGVEFGGEGLEPALDLGGLALGEDDPRAGQAVLVGVGLGAFLAFGSRWPPSTWFRFLDLARIWDSVAGMVAVLLGSKAG